jgi:hypothetical protein
LGQNGVELVYPIPNAKQIFTTEEEIQKIFDKLQEQQIQGTLYQDKDKQTQMPKFNFRMAQTAGNS